jgi:Tfp pilus assembly protein PilX
MKLKVNQNGAAHLVAAIIVIVIALIGVAGWIV